jgi:hypothetical protein
MLQIDHIYEFFFQTLFNDFNVYHCPQGVIETGSVSVKNLSIFTPNYLPNKKIFFYDQEPLLNEVTDRYLDIFDAQDQLGLDQLLKLNDENQLPYECTQLPNYITEQFVNTPDTFYTKKVLCTSEHSELKQQYLKKYNCLDLYYFFHGFAALDWYRGYYALNYNKPIVKEYKYDFISFNRIINNDRSYRIYFVSLLKEQGLLDHGQVSFNVTDNLFDDWRDEVADTNTKLSEHAKRHAEQHLINISKLVIDKEQLPGSASANIPRTIPGWFPQDDQPNADAFWHVVTETVFYYNKLHLTEKIFKPIVSKQPFMLLAAPGNLEYLRSYGFKTFDGIIDESYDQIQDNDARIDAVVKQLAWYCGLSADKKQDIQTKLEPIIEHNFNWFYNGFRQKIIEELLENCQNLFKKLGYDDSHISYTTISQLLTR